MRISHHHGYNNITACFDITASTSHRQSKSSLNSRTGNIRDSVIFPHLKGLCRSALSKWETRTVKMENDYTCQVCSVNVNVQSSFGLGMRRCVAMMVLNNGGKKRVGWGESNQLLGCNGGKDWAVPKLPESLFGVWMDWQCLQEMDGATMNNSYTS